MYMAPVELDDFLYLNYLLCFCYYLLVYELYHLIAGVLICNTCIYHYLFIIICLFINICLTSS